MQTTARRTVIAASFGNAMEWYDFSVYAFFASYIARNFFASGDTTSALLSTFVVFGAGFVARPIGAILVGIYGDRVGRKSALMLSIGAMGLGTLILVLAPPITMIGIGAPILLLIGRLLQGLSAGGEIGGAAAFMLEHAPAEKRGRYASWLQASMGFSNLLSAVLGFGITSVFPDSVVGQWAWRIPFAVGLLIIPVGLYVRRKLPETAQFTEHQQSTPAPRNPLWTLLREYPMRVLSGFLFSVQWTVCVYALVIYLPTYYAEPSIGLGFTARDSFLASLVGNIVLVAGCVAFGRIADRIGARPLILGSSIALLVLPVLALSWLHAQPNTAVLLLVHIVLCASVSGFVGVAPSTLPRAFPVAIRSTGLSLGYNIAAIAFAGTTPALMTWATVRLSSLAPAFWVMIGSLAALCVIPLLFKQIREVELAESGTSQCADVRQV